MADAALSRCRQSEQLDSGIGHGIEEFPARSIMEFVTRSMSLSHRRIGR